MLPVASDFRRRRKDHVHFGRKMVSYPNPRACFRTGASHLFSLLEWELVVETKIYGYGLNFESTGR